MASHRHAGSRRGFARGCAPIALVGVLMGAVVVGGLGGCAQKPLFPPDGARSQFDRAAAIRNQRAPSFVTDEFGNRRPNIRGRLIAGE